MPHANSKPELPALLLGQHVRSEAIARALHDASSSLSGPGRHEELCALVMDSGGHRTHYDRHYEMPDGSHRRCTVRIQVVDVAAIDMTRFV